MTFTPDEINLMCIYDTSDRERLIREMGRSFKLVEDKELADIMWSAIGKLGSMTDKEYSELELVPTITDEDTEE